GHGRRHAHLRHRHRGVQRGVVPGLIGGYSSPSRSAIHAPASAQTASPSTFIHSASPSFVHSHVGSTRWGPICSSTHSPGFTVTSSGASHVVTSTKLSEVCRAQSPLHAPSARATCSTCTLRGRSLRLVTNTVRDSE